MKKTTVLILFLICSVLCTSCDVNKDASNDSNKQWVYVELVTESKKDTSEYFYYGQVRESLYNDIKRKPDMKGLFVLFNVRYVNNDDLLELYEDDKLSGDLVFRIQDIEELVFYKDDPIQLFEIEDLHSSALELRNKEQ